MGPITLADVTATPTTEVATVDGSVLPWRDLPAGIVIDVPPVAATSEPTVLALRHLTARGRADAERR